MTSTALSSNDRCCNDRAINDFDVAIIGAGIVGAALFRELSRYRVRIVLLERENDVALGASRANSAIVHCGCDPKAGTAMARFNTAGNRMFPELCRQLDVPFVQNGSLICAFGDEELPVLKALFDNGRANGVEHLEILDAASARALEPNLSSAVRGALFAPTGGIVGPYELTTALAENGVVNGGELLLNFDTAAISRSDKGPFTVTAADGRTVTARYVVNAAGINADKVHNLIARPTFQIRPRRGEYYVFDKSQGSLFDRTIFVCPGKLGKGILVSPTVNGNLIAGPNAQDGIARDDTAVTAAGLAEVRAGAQRITEAISWRDTIRNFAGLRAISTRDDFIIEEAPDQKGFFDLAGIKSPGLTSAPAIALAARDLLADAGLELVEKKDFNPNRHETRFLSLPPQKRRALAERDSAYGRIVCRCESITEGEIIESIRRPVGATTLDGVKRRCRPGSGRCQGGFCSVRVLEILARELGKDQREILQDKAGSSIILGTRGPVQGGDQ
ncbi:MAG: NAD(P)/FAD-dependent oxidoreductase [Thermoguttaceae bacterium]|nr:NAD(P)/FAD-dependent oxidoreductase [Thermoguttaceae bacterium]